MVLLLVAFTILFYHKGHVAQVLDLVKIIVIFVVHSGASEDFVASLVVTSDDLWRYIVIILSWGQIINKC